MGCRCYSWVAFYQRSPSIKWLLTWFQMLPPAFIAMETEPWVRCFKKMGIGGVQSATLLLCLLSSFSPSPVFFHSVASLVSFSFSVEFFSLCVFNSFSFSQSPFVTLMSHPPSLNCFLFYTHSSTTPPPPRLSLLTVSDGSLYSAMSSMTGHAGSIRRTFGSQKLLKTENVWLLSE